MSMIHRLRPWEKYSLKLVFERNTFYTSFSEKYYLLLFCEKKNSLQLVYGTKTPSARPWEKYSFQLVFEKNTSWTSFSEKYYHKDFLRSSMRKILSLTCLQEKYFLYLFLGKKYFFQIFCEKKKTPIRSSIPQRLPQLVHEKNTPFNLPSKKTFPILHFRKNITFSSSVRQRVPFTRLWVKVSIQVLD